MSNTILLKSVNTTFYKEAPANGNVTPGNFLQRATDGDFEVKTSTAPQKLIAVENDLTAGEISTVYANGDRVRAVYLSSGDEVYTFVAAGADAIVIGDLLVFDGAGGVKKATTQADLGGTLTGTTDGDMADIADIALTTGDTYTDTAVNNAVNTAIGEANLQLKELQTALNAILPQTDAPVVATAIEAVDNSGEAAAARIKVEMV